MLIDDRPSKSPRRRRKGEVYRDFVIRYEGRFLGFLHAPEPIAAREAFGRVAREMRSRLEHFVPEDLALYRLVSVPVRDKASVDAQESCGGCTWISA